MTALTLSRSLTDPGTGVATAVQERRILWPLLALMAATSFASAAFALRWDPAPGILQKLEMAGQLKGMPEAELTEQITTAGRLKLVTGIASGVFVTPLMVLGIAIVLAIVAWLLGRKAPFPALFSASAVGMLPVALQKALWGVVALWQLGINEERARHLLPSSVGAWVHVGGPKLAGLLDSLDLFTLAAAALIGIGFAAATGMRKRSGLMLGLVLFVAYVGVFGIGIPGMVAGGGRGHGPGAGGPGGGA
ncbi:MAG TPA: YIP1 family protein [Myxococcaceae bacterium]|nr:YIP1 family protein [Myxococcaceae bacterium]